MSNTGITRKDFSPLIIGDDFARDLLIKNKNTGQPIDLVNPTPYVFLMKIRDCEGSLIRELSTVNGELILSATLGVLEMRITDTNTASLTEDINAVYGLEWTDPSTLVRTLIEGNLPIVKKITRA